MSTGPWSTGWPWSTWAATPTQRTWRRRRSCDCSTGLRSSPSAEHEKRWLLRVTVNLCRDCLKGFWRKRAVALEEDYPTAEPESFSVADAVVRLPEKYKAPIHLHYYEGYSVDEISEILGLSRSAVKMRMKRGRDMLKLEMEGGE